MAFRPEGENLRLVFENVEDHFVVKTSFLTMVAMEAEEAEEDEEKDGA
jgi:hypothetical protein